MRTELQAYELEIAGELIKSALSNSAMAFSKFINKNVTIKTVVIDHADNLSILTDDEGQFIHVLLSELKGDLRGKCYLNFSPTEAKELFHICLTPEYAQSENMTLAILMELDNILTAAVVSMIADRLKINTYAYVPHLYKLNRLQLSRLLDQDHQVDNLILHFKTSFKIDDIDLSPEFIWTVEKKLIDIIMDLEENNKASAHG